jgi:hypothetical protein
VSSPLRRFTVWRTVVLIILSFEDLHVNYLTIPVYVVGAASLVTVVYLSDKFKRRGVCIIACLVPVIVGYLIAVGTPNQKAGYAAMFILVLGKLYDTIYFGITNLVVNRNISHFYTCCYLDSRHASSR